jgi:5-oxoprolinase (ATP-hydrolysing)
LKAQLLADGAAADAFEKPSCILEMCYAGQSTLLPVSFGSVRSLREAFEAQHQQLYGYRHAERPVEIRIIRVELAAAAGKPGLLPLALGHAAECSSPPRSARMLVEGEPCDVPLYLRSDLRKGQQIIGPAIVAEATSTIIIDPGWRGEVSPTGDLVLIDAASRTPSVLHHREPIPARGGDGSPNRQSAIDNRQFDRTSPDPIALELFNNQFAAVAEQMGTTLRRTALSTNVKERLDFSCAVFTPEGDLVVNAPHIPVHLGGMSDCVKCLIEDVGAFAPGEVYVTNDPYRGGSHLNDLTVITPVHDEPGKDIIFFVASRAHHAEIGGKRPGSMPPDSTCLAEEGVLIRAFACVKNGIFRADELRAILKGATARHSERSEESPGDESLSGQRSFASLRMTEGTLGTSSEAGTIGSIDNRQSTIVNPYPSRSPDENLADIAAQIAANRRGVQDLQVMVARHGLDVVHAYMRHIQAAADQKARAAIRKLPSGRHEFTDFLDDGSPIRLEATMDGDQATFDFTGTGPVLPGNLNANRSIVTSAILYCLRCLIDEDIPLNGGVLAPVRIILPECFLNPPRHDDPRRCPAVAGGNVETSQRVVDTIFGALRTVAASQGTMNNLLIGNQRFGYYETICGGAGAGPTFDGADAVHTNMTNTRLTDPEVFESRYPLRLVRFEIRGSSGGTGKHRGGHGVIREIEFLEPLEVSIISQRRARGPYGLMGGAAGAPGRNALVRAAIQDQGRKGGARQLNSEHRDQAIVGSKDQGEHLPGIASFSASPGDRLIIETPGGGGWGQAR